MSTIRDIAARAGVSVSTASLALNGHGRVTPATRERVLAVARELRYRPTHAAKSLSEGRAYTLHLVDLGAVTNLAGSFFTRFAKGVHDVAQGEGYTVALSVLGEGEAEELLERLLAERRSDGVILLNPTEGDLPLGDADGRGLPHVVLGRGAGREWLSVDNDNALLAFDATRHLLDQGCEALLFLGGPSRLTFIQDRARGFERARDEAGLPRREGDALAVHGGPEEARRALHRLLDDGLAVDGVVAVSDVLAAGALRALLERGLRVPEDVAVVGMNDDDLCRVLRPSLSSVDLNAYRLGREAAGLLLEAIERTPETPVRRLVTHRLAVRESSLRREGGCP